MKEYYAIKDAKADSEFGNIKEELGDCLGWVINRCLGRGGRMWAWGRLECRAHFCEAAITAFMLGSEGGYPNIQDIRKMSGLLREPSAIRAYLPAAMAAMDRIFAIGWRSKNAVEITDKRWLWRKRFWRSA